MADEERECHRCEQPIDPFVQGGYVEQIRSREPGISFRTSYHRACWLVNEMETVEIR